MAINYIMDTLEGLPEAVQALYTPKDGKYILAGVQGVKTEDDVNRVMEALNKERNDHKATKERWRALQDYAPDEILSALDEASRLKQKASKEGTDDSLKLAPLQREKERLSNELLQAQNMIEQFKAREKERVISDAVRRAGTELKMRPTAIEDALLLAKLTFDVDDNGKVFTKQDGANIGGLEPSAWLSEMQQARPHWWPDNIGGGATGGNGAGFVHNNPWKKESLNLTQQGEIFKANPTLARQLAAAAGVTIK